MNGAAMSGSVQATISPGQLIQTSLTLSVTSNIARTFIVHFHIDSAFIEPCMRSVLQRVAEYAEANPGEKLVIVGHTDKAGSINYNQSLSERRSRSVFAYLTFGVDDASRTAALAEWNNLRENRPAGEQPSIKDSWDVREYQYILQELEFYPGPIDGERGQLTDDAVRAYRCQRGLPPGTDVDPVVWQVLVEDYLAQDSLAVPASQFFPNCSGEIFKWLGCGETDPHDRRATAFRPSRRVELMFVQTDRLPCQIPQPATFNLPTPGAVNSNWCVGGTSGPRCCFVSPILRPGRNDPQPCPTAPNGPWCRQPAESGTITVRGSIKREVRLPDGTTRLDPMPRREFVLITPNGEFKERELPQGTPRPARTDSNGEFSFSDLPVGIYTFEVVARRSQDYVLVRLDTGSYNDALGALICKHLTPADSQLNVVIVAAPVLREIRLPVVAHLMTARDANGILHATTRDETSVRRAFEEANRIWRQARIHFELEDIVKVTYNPPPAVQPSQVSEAEFFFISSQCSYPNVINVFFVQDVGNPTEAGFGTSFEGGAANPACAIEDLNDRLSAITLAHELGHFLHLGHPEEQPGATGSFADRLMHGGLGFDTQLIDTEVASARTSRGAQLECLPLKLRVTGGAVQIGGTRSPNYVALQQAAAGPITVEAQIPPALLAMGTVTMTGGTEVPGFPLRRNVNRTATGRTSVKAVFSMTTTTSAGTATRTYRDQVNISVVNRQLEVQNAQRLGSAGSNIYVAEQTTGDTVTIVANVTPTSALPNCIPNDIVQWAGGDSVPGDPFRRTVSKTDARQTEITATFAGVSHTVIIRVYDLEFVRNQVPFQAEIDPVSWRDTFRIRADLPGETRDEITIEITSYLIRR